ncbi:MAG: prolyl oligopeptidase family serine peptidase [Longimonas sp.]|uniref:S9 family peptidase n=1 Tax=Longimonas sp. TaxID=2039626 RepID=UPI00334BC278
MRLLLPAVAALLVALFAAASQPLHAQTPDEDHGLSVQQIMQDPDTWIGSWPSNARWHENGSTLYFDWNPEGEFPSDSLYAVPVDGDEPVKVDAEERRAPTPFFSGWHHGTHTYTSDFTRKVFLHNGDVYLYNRDDDTTTRLTRTSNSLSQPRFSPDGSRVVFRDGLNLFAIHLEHGTMQQLTDVRAAAEPTEEEPSPQEQYLKEQQIELFETLRERQEEEELAEEAQEEDAAADPDPPTLYVGEESVVHVSMDPSERFTAVGTSESQNAENTQVIDYVTETGFAEVINARAKVGRAPSGYTLHLADAERDTTYTVDLSTLPGADEWPMPAIADPDTIDGVDAERTLRAFGPYWNEDGSLAVLDVRADDNKDRWLARLHPEDGSVEVLDRQRDDAWIAGPGISWFGGASTLGWMPDGETLYFQSEATGYSHLYTVNVATGETSTLTEGRFEVFDPQLTQDGSAWIFASSEDSPYNRHWYRMPAEGGERTRITSGQDGRYTAAPHPDDTTLGLLYEYITQPPEIYIRDDNGERRITTSPTDAWQSIAWDTGTITEFDASDGAAVPMQIFEPDEPNGAAVHFVHGAGYLQNVHNGWSNYFREFMFHNLLMQQGYTVVNLDFRASAGYGRDWRTAVYRHMGGRDLQDYVDASAYLEDTRGIDSERQFIYGGSYGGFITLMALFNEATSFGGGAALRAVTDWAHYNHPYTSNILNTPIVDPEAFERSSPIYFAEGLDDPLLMTHGLIDANVQPQDIFRLSQRLIELGKTDWELATYPVEPHGFTEPSSWTDQYRRILYFIERSVGPERIEQAW